MKKLLLALVLLPITATAEYLPAGCYVADYYRTDACWSASDNFSQWTAYDNRDYGASFYGATVEAIVYRARANEIAGQRCSSDYANLYNQCETKKANDASYIQSLGDAYETEARKRSKLNTLVSKLRKACGSKCSRIK